MGHRAGKKKLFQEISSLLSTPAKSTEEAQKAEADDGGENTASLGKGAVGLAECREDEDGVVMGGSGECFPILKEESCFWRKDA